MNGPGGGEGGRGQRRMTPKGQMSGNGSGPAIAHLPPMMKAMFEARAPIEHKPPIVKRRMPPYSGIAALVAEFESTQPEKRPDFQTPNERRVRLPIASPPFRLAKERPIASMNPASRFDAHVNHVLQLFAYPRQSRRRPP